MQNSTTSLKDTSLQFDPNILSSIQKKKEKVFQYEIVAKKIVYWLLNEINSKLNSKTSLTENYEMMIHLDKNDLVWLKQQVLDFLNPFEQDDWLKTIVIFWNKITNEKMKLDISYDDCSVQHDLWFTIKFN
jgi:hypothetical protein